MRKLTVSSFFLIFSLFLQGCGGDEQVSVPPVDEELFRTHVRVLASDAFEGRAPMTKGEERTVKYLQTEMQKLGLTPLFGSSYQQPVNLISIEVAPVPVEITKENWAITLNYGSDIMIGTRKTEPTVSLEDSELVFIGFGINAPELGWNDYDGVDVKGKTVVMLVNDPGYYSEDPNQFKGKTMTYYGRWTYKFDQAAVEGAAGAIIIHDTRPAAYPWSVVETSWSGPQIHLTDNKNPVAKMDGWIAKNVAEQLFSEAGLSLNSLIKRAVAGPIKGGINLGSKLSVTMKTETRTGVSSNVGAKITGKSKPDEIIYYMAHWDHLGKSSNQDPHTNSGPNSKKEDVIFNGALDNATGTAGLIEMARVISTMKTRPERSIGFLFYTAEESGLLGSKAFAQSDAFDFCNNIGGINLDGMNINGPVTNIEVTGAGQSEYEDYLKRAANLQNREPVPEGSPEKGFFFRSDHFSFAKEGIPGSIC